MHTGERLRAERDRLRWSRQTAIQALVDKYPEHKIDPKTLQRIESGEARVSPLRAQALCDIYGADFAQVCPDLVEGRQRLLTLLTSDRSGATSSWGDVASDLPESHAA